MSLKDPYTSLQAFIEHGHTDRIGDLVICQLVTVLISDDTELFEPTASKIYRHPTFYEVPDEVGHM